MAVVDQAGFLFVLVRAHVAKVWGGGIGGAQLPPLQSVEESGSCFQQP